MKDSLRAPNRYDKKPKKYFKPRDYFGAVYLMHNALSQQYKIGITALNPDRRRRGLENQAGIPVMLVEWWELDAYVETMETQLHKYFDEYRTLGEWFRFPDTVCEEDIRSKIERLITGTDSFMESAGWN